MSGGMEVGAPVDVPGNTPQPLQWRAQTCHVRARFTTLVYGTLFDVGRAPRCPARPSARPSVRKPLAPGRCLLINPYSHPAFGGPMLRRVIFPGLCVAALLGSASLGAQTTAAPAIPETPAGRVLRTWLDAFNSGD